MRKSFLKTFGYFACFAWSSMACAVGFGGINVTSSLGRPLVAEIELVAVDKADKTSLNAHLASPEAFKGAGIDYPYALPKLKFQVETRANGESYIKVSSDQAVNDPFVSLLLELTWSSGRLLREYTFLLDPPGFVAEQPPAAAVNPIEPVVAPAPPVVEPVAAPVAPVAEPVVAASAPQAEAIAETSPQAPAEPAPAPVANEAASAVIAEVAKPVEAKVETLAKEESHPAEAPVKKQAVANAAAASPITVKPGDTLVKIANKSKASDVTLERMLVALYHANEQEFDGHNMNRIRTGKILRLPEADELAKVQQPEAVEEVHAQVADWNAYRQKLAAANTPAAEGHAKQEVAGKISTSIADKAPVAKESAKEVLKLSKGEAEGDQASAGGKAKSAQEKAIAKEEEAIAKAKALKETEQRAALLEKNIKEMQRLVELKNQAASANASAIPLIASSTAAVSAPTPASAAASASAVAPAKPKVAGPKVVAEPPTLLDELLEDPIKLGAAAAAVLGLGLLAAVRSRRNKNDVKPSTNKVAEPILSTQDMDIFTHAEVLAAAPVDSDEVDPIKEADLFLNFGRDVQAEEVLKEALVKDPSNNQIKLKLLSIYATRNDTKSFQNYALEIKKSRDESSWEQAAAMGRDIDPDNALYNGGIDSVAVASVKEPVEETKSALDFDADIPPALDFDLGDDEVEKVAVTAAVELPPIKEVDIDFDLGEIKAAAVDEPKLEFPALDIDVAEAKSVASATPADQTPSLNLDDLVFETTPTAAAEVDENQPLEFTMDFPSEAKPAAAPLAKDIGLSEISLNLDEPPTPSTPQSGGSKDEHWQEVATKLDLAKAYQEMGDQAGAREILEEVVRDGDAGQREAAESLLQQLS